MGQPEEDGLGRVRQHPFGGRPNQPVVPCSTSLCGACEYRRYLAATGGRDLANEERTRWGQPPIPTP
jgi:hypothetical protein